jgi:hypothetical protein
MPLGHCANGTSREYRLGAAGEARVARLPGPLAISTVPDADNRRTGTLMRASFLDLRAATAGYRLGRVLPGPPQRAL